MMLKIFTNWWWRNFLKKNSSTEFLTYIRFRKLSLVDVKDTCPLFRQKGLSVNEKVKNLETLISSQLEFCALANMEDLEEAIANCEVSADVVDTPLDVRPATSKKQKKGVQSLIRAAISVSEVIVRKYARKTSSSWHCLKMVLILVKCWRFSQIASKQVSWFLSSLMESGDLIWKLSSQNDEHVINKLSILPICPSLDISLQHSKQKRRFRID